MNIVNGIIQDKEIFGLKVKIDIVEPKGKKNVRTLRKMETGGLTVHNTGNSGKGAGDESHSAHIQNVENNDTEYVSWHLTVDSDSVTQHIPLNEMAYHAGDGSGFGNTRTIGIEIAEPIDQKYSMCEDNALKVIVWLMIQYNFSIDDVQPHRKYSSIKKLCPWRILKSQTTWEKDWKNFQTNRILTTYNKYKEVKPVTQTKPVVEKEVDTYSDYAKKACDKAVKLGIVKGDGSNYNWTKPITKQDLMVILDNLGLLK